MLCYILVISHLLMGSEGSLYFKETTASINFILGSYLHCGPCRYWWLIQDCNIFSALAMEILQSCAKPSIWFYISTMLCLSNFLVAPWWFCKSPCYIYGSQIISRLPLHSQHHSHDNIYMAWDILAYWGRDKMAAIFQTTFWSGFSWMKIYEFRLKFHWNLSN